MKIIALIAILFYVASATQPYVSYRSPFPSPGGVTYINGVAPVGLVAQPIPYSANFQHVTIFVISFFFFRNFKQYYQF